MFRYIYFILFFALTTVVHSQQITKQKLIIVPFASSSESQIMSDVIGQKMLAFFQKNRKISRSFFSNIIFSTKNTEEDENFKNIAQKYFKQDNDVVIILWASKKQNAKIKNKDVKETEYNTRILFFQKNVDEKLDETKITTKLDKMLATNSFSNSIPELKKNKTINLLSQISELQFFIKEAKIRIEPIWDQKTETPEYSVIVNGKKERQTSLKTLRVTKQTNYIQILQENVVIGAFIVELNSDEYFVKVPLQTKEEIVRLQKKQIIKFPYLTSLFTIDVLAGGILFLYTTEPRIPLEKAGFIDLIGGMTRLSVKLPKVPYFRMGLEMPFGFTAEKNIEIRPSFLGFSGFVGAAFPLVAGLELSLNVGGGVFLLHQAGNSGVTGEVKQQVIALPEAFMGLNIDYNIPIKNSGYFRVTFSVVPYVVPMNIVIPIDDRVPATILKNQVINIQLGLFAGLGWRF